MLGENSFGQYFVSLSLNPYANHVRVLLVSPRYYWRHKLNI